jgi:AAA+ ATPase superfamily predicted ATPase
MGAHTRYRCPYMYFDSRPKTTREDLYDRDEQMGRFLDVLSYAPLVVVTGLRRTGKTSFLNVALAESNYPYAILDLRGLPYNPSYADVVRRLEVAFKVISRKWFSDVAEALRHVGGVTILGNELSFQWGKAGIDLPELFAKIDDWATKKGNKFLMAFDEIQLVRGDKWLLRFLAHVIDSYHNVVLAVTGSEVGVLFDFLGFEKPDSPLYGRHFVQIHMDHFSPSAAEDFLTKGFKQVRIMAPLNVIEYAVKRLDGVVGWLTLFGVRCRDKGRCSMEVVDEVASEAGRLSRDEAAKVVEMSKRYGTILNFLARVDGASWSQIKASLETEEARSITNSAVSTLIKNLTNIGIISSAHGTYSISDPLLVSQIKEEPFPK